MELLEDCNPIAIMEFHCNGRTRRPTGGPGSIFPGRLARLLRWDSMIALGLLWDSELWRGLFGLWNGWSSGSVILVVGVLVGW